MTGFVDVLLRGLILALVSLVLGGVVWTRWIVRAGSHAAPAPATTLALRVGLAGPDLAPELPAPALPPPAVPPSAAPSPAFPARALEVPAFPLAGSS